MRLSRRNLIQGGILMAAGAMLGDPSPLQPQSPATSIPDRGPRLDADLVRDFVIAAHGDLAKTRELLEGQPALVNATWDWGGGDWETALGGAAHMGNREIAELLLSRGARMDIFCAAMLGRIAVVRAFLADDPKIVDLKGPHGIPLLRHAMAGKQETVVELLKAHGAK
jgi:hypothetical protein